MLSVVAKFLLVATSLSPVLGAVAIRQATQGSSCTSTSWIWWLIVAIVLILLCKGLLAYAEKNAQRCTLHFVQFERKDQEALTFLFIYLLPFLRSDDLALSTDWIMTAYVLSIIVVCIIYSGAFHFNPVMQWLGYRFFAVRDSNGVSILLISKKNLQRPRKDVDAVMLAPNVYLQLGESDV